MLQANVVWNCPVIDLTLVKPLPANDSASRIVGGQLATPGQFPYQVGIWIKESFQTQAFCGGSILNNSIVLTAGHCVKKAQKVIIIAGAHNINQKEASHQVRRVDKMIIHDGFDAYTLLNDIALLHLAAPLEFNARVGPIDLPSWTESTNSFTSAKVVLSGWGQNATFSQHVSSALLFVQSQVIGNLSCKVRFFLQAIIRSTHVCVSGRWARGPCQGDSGGPLVTTGLSKKPILIGLTSFGLRAGCALSWPSVFTRITSYLDWIKQGMRQLMRAQQL